MKKNLSVYKELWRVQTINYFTDATNIVLGIVLTTVTMICWVAFKGHVGGMSGDYFVLASAIGISIIRNSQYDLNLTVTDWRQKHLFERLSATPIPKSLMTIAILSFNWFINIAVALLLFVIAMFFPNQREILGNVQWGPYLVGFAMDVILSNIMALFLTVLWQNRALVLVVSLVSYFGPMYLLGLGIPWSTVGDYAGLNQFLYIAPHRYPLALMQAGWAGTAYGQWGNMAFPNMDMIYQSGPLKGQMAFPTGAPSGGYLATHGFGYNGAGWWAPFLISVAWTLLFGGITIAIVKYRVNFGARKVKQYKGVQKHLHYISQIKKARNIDELNSIMQVINASENRQTKVEHITRKRKELHKEYE